MRPAVCALFAAGLAACGETRSPPPLASSAPTVATATVLASTDAPPPLLLLDDAVRVAAAKTQADLDARG